MNCYRCDAAFDDDVPDELFDYIDNMGNKVHTDDGYEALGVISPPPNLEEHKSLHVRTGFYKVDPDWEDYIDPESFMTCCGQDLMDCRCSAKERTAFLDAHEYAIAWTNVMTYETEGGCGDCVFIYTANCAPYREWLHKALDTHPHNLPSLEKIEMCDDYVSHVQANKEGIIDADGI